MRQNAHFINANGLRHFVSDSGPVDGDPVILLHGFPESHAAWNAVTPLLADTGYRVIAPDLRGFGQSDMGAKTADYDLFAGAVPDVLAICDALQLRRAHLVGHDFGAPVAWILAAQHPRRFRTMTALSVGHIRAYLKGGLPQLLKSWYILFHQMRGVCEASYRMADWAMLRWHWRGRDDMDNIIADLVRPGRLTAGLNWYRANIPVRRMLRQPKFGAFGEEIVRIPTLGVWPDGDRYLGERQMTLSRRFVDAPWRYEWMSGVSHWIPTKAPNPLAALLLDFWQAHPDA